MDWLKGKWTLGVALTLEVVAVPGVIEDGKVWGLWISSAIGPSGTWAMVGAGLALLVGHYLAKAMDKVTMQHTLAFSPWTLAPRRPTLQEFNLPILDAIRHLLNSPHSYTESRWAERQAFTMLHREMCSGRLLVIGKEHDFAAPRRISIWECRKLVPIEVVVMPSPAAPDAVRFVLSKPPSGNADTDEDLSQLSDLRVRSSDLYRIWPL